MNKSLGSSGIDGTHDELPPYQLTIFENLFIAEVALVSSTRSDGDTFGYSRSGWLPPILS
jgi:hypothetical protein